MTHLDTKSAFAFYESIRHRLPRAHFPHQTQKLRDLEALLDVADGFFLDAFGVLNVGEYAIPHAHELIEGLREQKKPFCVLSNSASIPKSTLITLFNRFGFDFKEHEIITSREVLWQMLPLLTLCKWGVINPSIAPLERDIHALSIEDKGFWESDAFLFLGSHCWDEALHVKWREHLHKNPRPIWVGNPDITAPRGKGIYSKEPGFYTLLEEETLFAKMHFVGKPFGAIFEYALQKALHEWHLPKERLVMVGDTLHTDILGATAVGIQSVLIEEYGFFAHENVQPYIEKSGIVPTFSLAHYR